MLSCMFPLHSIPRCFRSILIYKKFLTQTSYLHICFPRPLSHVDVCIICPLFLTSDSGNFDVKILEPSCSSLWHCVYFLYQSDWFQYRQPWPTWPSRPLNARVQRRDGGPRSFGTSWLSRDPGRSRATCKWLQNLLCHEEGGLMKILINILHTCMYSTNKV